MSRRRRLGVLLGVLGFGALMLGPLLSTSSIRGLWGIPQIEDHLEGEASEVLGRLDLPAFAVEASGNDLTVETIDELPGSARNALTAIDGVGDIDFVSQRQAPADDGGDDDPAVTATDPDEETDEPEPEPTVAPAGGGELDFSYDGVTASLSGEVQTEEGRDAAVRSAVRLVGVENVVDNITVTGGPGSDLDRVTTAAAVIRRLDEWYTIADMQLSGETLAISGNARDEAAAERAGQVVGQLGTRVGLETTVDSAIVVDGSAPTDETLVAAGEVVSALDLSGIAFEPGSATLTPASAPILDDIAARLRELPGVPVDVQGHTDNEGDPDVNLLLSQDRAVAVRDYLVAAGVADSSLTARGFGSAQPLADNSTAEGRAANNRIGLVVSEGN